MPLTVTGSAGHGVAGAMVVLLWTLLGVAPRSSYAAGPPASPPIFAAYYTWYATATGPHGRWAGWDNGGKPSALNPSGHDPGRFAFPPHLRDIASAAYPLVGVYDSDDREVVRWHIELAKAAGIDGFFVSWWGPGTWQGVPGLTETSFERAVLPLAEELGFKVALMDETAQFHNDFEQVKRWAAEYLGKYKDSPAYLHIDGKPVYYLYQVSFDPKLTPATYRELVAYVEQRVGPVYWVIDKVSNADDRLHIPAAWTAGGKVADAYACYSTFSNFRQWTYDELLPRHRSVVRDARGAGAKMMLPAHPGHDNSRLRAEDVFVIPRDDGDTLRGYLRACRDAGADFILLTSWNEWPETTGVEPAVTWADPYRYLRVVAEFEGVDFLKPAEPPRVRPGRTTVPAAATRNEKGSARP